MHPLFLAQFTTLAEYARHSFNKIALEDFHSWHNNFFLTKSVRFLPECVQWKTIRVCIYFVFVCRVIIIILRHSFHHFVRA